MSTTYQVMRLLATGEVCSGTYLASTLNITRSAVWKQVEVLRKRGLPIISIQGKGYQLSTSLELLDAKRLYPMLSSAAAKTIRRISVLPEVDSTNRWVKNQAEPGVIVAIAEYQNAGSGRRGKYWECPPGAGLLLSIRWPMGIGISALNLLSLQCGLAVARSIEKTTGLSIELKWPNDIICEQKKIAGILVEVEGHADGDCTVVIGVGINLNWPQASLQELQASIHASDHLAWLPGDCSAAESALSRHDLAANIINEMTEMMGAINTNQVDTSKLLEAWQARDVLYAQNVLVKTNQNEFEGQVLGLTDHGALLIQSVEQRHELHGSDVSIRLLAKDELR